MEEDWQNTYGKERERAPSLRGGESDSDSQDLFFISGK